MHFALAGLLTYGDGTHVDSTPSVRGLLGWAKEPALVKRSAQSAPAVQQSRAIRANKICGTLICG